MINSIEHKPFSVHRFEHVCAYNCSERLLSTYAIASSSRHQGTKACAHWSVWSLPRPQLWFERLLNDRSLDGWWKEHFRVSRATFEYICRLVGPALFRQDTAMRKLRRNLCCQTEHRDWLLYLGHQNAIATYHVKCHGRFVPSFWRIHGYLTRKIYLGKRRSNY